jgi:hypothetical protein
MPIRRKVLEDLIFGRSWVRAERVRRSRRANVACESLEGRVTPAHGGIAHHALARLHAAAQHAHHRASIGSSSATDATSTTTKSATSSSSDSGSSSGSAANQTDCASRNSDSGSEGSSNSVLTSALQTLRGDVQTIELASNTTIGQLTAIRVANRALANDGLSPSSAKALSSFEDSLVTSNASGTTLAGDSALLSQFEALYTGTPTAQQATDLTTAYNALAAAVTSANITSAGITTINTDWAAVQAARGSTSTATYPYFSLVTGRRAESGGCDGMDGMGATAGLKRGSESSSQLAARAR